MQKLYRLQSRIRIIPSQQNVDLKTTTKRLIENETSLECGDEG